jgi:hypothetical protein
MSLTGELDKKDSPVTRWFSDRLPNAKPISKWWYERVKSVPIVRPEVDLRIPGTVGTAFDYRLRYYLALTPLEDMIAGTGMRLLDPSHHLTRPTRPPRADDAVHASLTRAHGKPIVALSQPEAPSGSGGLGDAVTRA